MDRVNTLTSDLRKSFTCSVDVIKMGLSQCLYTNMTVQFIQTASVRESSVRIHTHTHSLSLPDIYIHYIEAKNKIVVVTQCACAAVTCQRMSCSVVVDGYIYMVFFCCFSSSVALWCDAQYYISLLFSINVLLNTSLSLLEQLSALYKVLCMFLLLLFTHCFRCVYKRAIACSYNCTSCSV